MCVYSGSWGGAGGGGVYMRERKIASQCESESVRTFQGIVFVRLLKRIKPLLSYFI